MTWTATFFVLGCEGSRTPAKTIMVRFADMPEDREIEELMIRYEADTVTVRPPTTQPES